MKQIVSFLTTSLVLLLFISSCSMEKRHYMPGYYVEWMNRENNSMNKKITLIDSTKQNEIVTGVQQVYIAPLAENDKIVSGIDLIASTDSSFNVSNYQDVFSHKYIKPSEKIIPSIKNQYKKIVLKEICDTIVLNSGEKIIGKIIEIKRNEYIKYKLCGEPKGKVLKIDMSSVSMVKYSNQFEPEDIGKYPYKYGLLAAFIVMAGIILGIIAIVYGIVSLKKIKKYPEKYKGRIKAIIGIILGSIGIICSLPIFIMVLISLGFI